MAEPPVSGRRRLAIIDVARGIAIIAMVLYHATWDLGPDFFGLIGINAAQDPILVVIARTIAGSFLFLVGVGLVLAHQRGLRPKPFLRRLAIIIGATLLITIVTRLAIPHSYARFGILHSIAAASVIGFAFLRAPIWLVLVAAVAAFAAPSLLASPFFNDPVWLWLSLSTFVPDMIDYEPVLPWVGPTLVGIAATRISLSVGLDAQWANWQPTSAVGRGVIIAGRWSLVIYLIHRPILLGMIYLIVLALGRPVPVLF